MEIQDNEDSNSQKTWIMCPPATDQVLNIKLPILVILLKSMQSQCFFQLQFVDKNNIKHLINFSNVEPKKNTVTKFAPPRMHLVLEPGWNKLELDLFHLSKIFETEFEAVCRLKICASCRIRRIYFTDRHYDDNEMPLGLYQGFLDLYMLKWGIKTVERSSQTKKTTGKLGMKESSLHPANGFNKLFLKNLQAKSDKVIEEFFSKQPVKSTKDYLDFKRKAKIKPYAVPEGNKINIARKSSDSSLVDLSDLKKSFLKESYLYGKLAFEEKNEKKDKVQESNDKQVSKYSVYKIRKYRFPEITERKLSGGKIEKLSRYPNFHKL